MPGSVSFFILSAGLCSSLLSSASPDWSAAMVGSNVAGEGVCWSVVCTFNVPNVGSQLRNVVHVAKLPRCVGVLVSQEGSIKGFVVGVYVEAMAFNEVAKMLDSLDDGKKFSVVCAVLGFSRVELL